MNRPYDMFNGVACELFGVISCYLLCQLQMAITNWCY